MSTNQPQVLAWDTDFLGFSVGRVTLDGLAEPAAATLLADSRQVGLELLYCFVRPDDEASAAALRQLGARLMDRKVTYAMPLRPEMAAEADPTIQPTTTWSEALRSMALQSGEYSRFRLDEQFRPEVFVQLYETWLRNSLSGQLARAVLVHRAPDGTENGLLTLGEKNGRADIGLLAVDRAARGGRIGKRLVQQAQRLALDWGYAELQVVTQQDNESACRFYESCGFRPDQVEHIYHLWLR